MAIYYVRKTGSDSNNGLSAGAAFLTLAKLLGGSGMGSGDTAYIGAGQYREFIQPTLLPAVQTLIIADVDGSHTGDPGEVQVTGYATNDRTAPSGSTLINLNGANKYTFQDFVFVGSWTMVSDASGGSANISFIRCAFIISGGFGNQNFFSIGNTPVNTALNWLIDSCTFVRGFGNTVFNINPIPKPSAADLDLNFVVKNCLFLFGTSIVLFAGTSGANTFKAGGIKMYNNTFFSTGPVIQLNDSGISTTIPCLAYNNLIYCCASTVFIANTSGQILEDYNILNQNSALYTNVTAGSHTISDGSIAMLLYTGHEFYSVGSNLKPFGMPKPGSPLLGFGNNSAGPVTDILGAARPSGLVKAANGTATSGAAKTLTDSGASWGINAFAGLTVSIISGTGNGQTKSISSNTATVLTVDGNWKTNPDSTSVYEIYTVSGSSTGKATSGSTTSLTDSNAAWGVNMWQGYTLHIDSGTGSGQTLLVTSNTATALTFAAATAPDSTSTYSLYRGTGINVLNPGVGCYELGQSAIRETATIRTGSNSIRIPGAGYQDFVIPVNATATNITIYARYDTAYAGTKPSLNIVNGTECGVANATATQSGIANNWEQLTLTFTPTAQGIITIRLISSSTTPIGNAFFDDFNVF